MNLRAILLLGCLPVGPLTIYISLAYGIWYGIAFYVAACGVTAVIVRAGINAALTRRP